MEMTWPTAVAILGTVASALLALVKIMTLKDDKAGKELEKLQEHNQIQDERSEKNRSDIQTLMSEVSFLHSRLQSQNEAIEKLEDILIKLLTEK